MSFAGDLRAVVRHRDFRRLFATRLTSQAADGAFQAALASLFFFSPEKQTSAGSVAAAFATLLLPYSLVGPFAGRAARPVAAPADPGGRQPAARRAWCSASPASAAADVTGVPLYAAVLACLSVNRFFLAGLSAALPHVVDPGRAGDGQLGVHHHRHGRGDHRRRDRLRASSGCSATAATPTPRSSWWPRSATPSPACSRPGWTATCSGRTSTPSRRRPVRPYAGWPAAWSTAPGTCGTTGPPGTPSRRSAGTGSSTASRPSRRSCCSGRYFHDPDDVDAGLAGLAGVVRRVRGRLLRRRGGHARGHPAAAQADLDRGLLRDGRGRPRRCSSSSSASGCCTSARSCSASRRRARRSASTRSCRPRSTTPTAAGSSPSTTSSSTSRSSRPRRSARVALPPTATRAAVFAVVAVGYAVTAVVYARATTQPRRRHRPAARDRRPRRRRRRLRYACCTRAGDADAYRQRGSTRSGPGRVRTRAGWPTRRAARPRRPPGTAAPARGAPP